MGVKNRGYEVSLEHGKVYQVLADAQAAKHHLTRVVNKSGEDYLYPSKLFMAIKWPLNH